MPTTINPSNQTISQYNVQSGGANNTLNNIAPGTTGYALTSNGASAQPSFQVLPVSGGGTGGATAVPYEVVCGGTTSTGPFQQVSGLGTAGQVLTSAGPGALPTWQNTGGGIGAKIISSGTSPINLSPLTATNVFDFTGYNIGFGTLYYSYCISNNPNNGLYQSDMVFFSSGYYSTNPTSIFRVGTVTPISRFSGNILQIYNNNPITSDLSLFYSFVIVNLF